MTNYALLYPYNGGRKTIAKGQVSIDFVEGQVNREDGTTEYLLTSLRGLQENSIQSILIEVDQTSTVQYDGGPIYTIDGGDISRLIYTDIHRIIIATTQSTQIRVWGSTHPEGVPEKFSSAVVGGKVTNTPNSSVGRPFSRMSRGSVLGSYTNIATYTVPGVGTHINLREIALDANTIGSVLWKLSIGGEQQFTGLTLVTPYAFPYPDNTLTAGTVIRVQAKSIGGGTYKGVAGISGVKY